MDTTTRQQPYQDSPTSSRSASPIPQTLPSSTNSSTTVKPLPALPPTYSSNEPYRDEPSQPPRDATDRDDLPSHPTHAQYHDSPSYAPPNRFEQPYTDSPPLTPNDDNIPLAHFLHQAAYPSEAPPSYSVAVHSRRDTLIQYIPSNDYTLHRQHQQYVNGQQHARSVVIDIDEETGEVVSRTDDVRHGVEKVVAMFIVAIVLLVLSGVLAWMAFGGLGLKL